MAEPSSKDEKINAQQQCIQQSQKWSWGRWRWGKVQPIPSEREVSKEPLEYEDIWLVNPDRAIVPLSSKLRESFQLRVAQKKKHPLLEAIHDTFRREIWLDGICRLLSDVLLIFAPFTLRYLIAFMQDAWNAHHYGEPIPKIGRGVGLMLGILGMQIVQSPGDTHFLYRSMVVGGQTCSVLISAIFEKSLRLSMREKVGATGKSKSESKSEGWTNGRIMNLMSHDTQRIFQASNVVHLVWTSPLAILLAVILVIINLTYSALPGVGFLVIGLFSLSQVVKFLASRRDIIYAVADRRVSLTQEILQGVRFVKCFAWERAFQDRLSEIRAQAIRSVQVLLTMRSAIGAVSMALPIFATLFAFITFALSNHALDAATIFSSLALFNSLRTPLNWLPVAIGQVADALASVRRIEEFLQAEEHEEQAVWELNMAAAVELRNASFTWERGMGTDQSLAPESASAPQPVFELHDLDLTVPRNELLAVVGTVGAGKTSLLTALAGEMRRTGGTMVLGASRAFCPQYAWIQNATVRDNIVFGQPFDSDWYYKVVDACALRADFRSLSAGDMTEIRERGINLSGGQKQRVNLARAVYSHTDIMLMDDPLSAVDAHVALRGLQSLGTLSVQREEGDEKAKPKDEGKCEDRIEHVDSTVSLHDDGALMTAEGKAVKSVPWSVYLAYIRASGSILNAVWIFLLLVGFRGANIMTGLWLSYWSAQSFDLSRSQWIGIYAGLACLQGVLLFAFSLCTSVVGTNASRKMLNQATWHVLRSPMSFFDTTPLGRITHRFTKDIDVMDMSLTDSLRMYLVVLSMIIGVFILTIAYFYYFAAAIAPLTVLLVIWTAYYRSSARELKRFEAVLDSSVYARFSEALSGTSSIRSYGRQQQFTSRVQSAIDDMNSAHFLTFGNQRWLSLRLDSIGNALVFTSRILAVAERYNISPSISGLVLSYSLSVVQLIQFTVRQLAELESAMNGTERIHEYTGLEPEGPLDLGMVRPTWPEQGQITFENVTMRYCPGLPLVLNRLNLAITGGERIGIIGRTGAGKSSIVSALFRLVKLAEGSITIDGVDISQIGLHELRARVSIIPQDPTFVRGTVRSNLDPFNEHTDAELWNALLQSHLVDANNATNNKSHESEKDGSSMSKITLDGPVDEEGSNYSLGQRQLLAFARAKVRDSRIVVIDEGTSSIDTETDMKIQETIVSNFRGKTLLSIAHRLRTIIGYNRICVMDKGEIAELGPPLELWKRMGIFRSMCDRSGIRREDIEAAR
ncbi:ABC transporter C family member 1 [Aspergillus lentulus]|uniref:ABC transporter C family member 1 n=1 Tax=Aspergillus lentulus TaxID=293939 RepID=UPI001395467A|nr:ABC transporter C family member 1 [Aspergillus lentulus]GFF26271.1 ABC transporter C family member 1 [Aspergillus lentulus]